MILGIRVAPGSSRQGIVGPHGGDLKVAVREPPERGRANRAVLALLAEILRIPRSDLEVIGGAGSRSKRLLVRGLSSGSILSRLESAL